jgi:TolB-like protein
MRHLALLSLLCVLPWPVLAAQTLAVLPLEEGAGSEEYAGLGNALAGMLVSDLSRVETLQLVERSRLEDILGEIALGDGGFLDPATAQELGQGLGAELVITGSYSVVGATFLMDARVVEVESAAVLGAADAQGTVEDFVTVEKDLVEALLEELELAVSSSVRRKMLTATPTEIFQAFASYGEGLDHEAAGRVDAARGAFEQALELDPEFELARDAVASMRASVEDEQARRARQRRDHDSIVRQRVLDAIPDERERPPKHTHDVQSLAGFGLRLLVLEDLGLHCQQYDEMWHYLDSVDWQVSQPPAKKGHDLFETTMLRAIEWEMIKEPHSLRTIPFDDPDVADMPSLFRDAAWFVLDLDATQPADPKGHGLIAAMQRCYTPAEQLEQAERILARTRETATADIEQSRHTPGVTLGDHLYTAWAILRAKHFGANEEVSSRLESTLDRMTTEEGRSWATNRLRDAAQKGDYWDHQRAARHGLDNDEIVALGQALVDGQGGPIDWSDAACAGVAAQTKPVAEWNVKRHAEALAEGVDGDEMDTLLGSWGYQYGTLMLLGCVQGHEGRIADVYEAYAYVSTADQRAREDRAEEERCVQAFARVEEIADPSRLESMAGNDAYLNQQIKYVLDWYFGALVLHRCVDEL